MKSVNLALPPITVPAAQIAGWTVRTTFITDGAVTTFDVPVNAGELVIFAGLTGINTGVHGRGPFTPYPMSGAKVRAAYPCWCVGSDATETVREVTVLQIETSGVLRWNGDGCGCELWGVVMVPSLVSGTASLGQRELPVDAGYSLSSLAYQLEGGGGYALDAAAVSISLHGFFIQIPYSWHPMYLTPIGTATMTRVYGDGTTAFQVLVCTGAGTVFPAGEAGQQGRWWVFNPRTQVVSLA